MPKLLNGSIDTVHIFRYFQHRNAGAEHLIYSDIIISGWANFLTHVY